MGQHPRHHRVRAGPDRRGPQLLPVTDHRRLADRPRAVNSALRPSRIPPPAGIQVLGFHRQMPGYRPTPLHRLDGHASAVGVAALYLKDESNRFGLPAFKILGASWAVAQALRARPDTRVLIAASAGNHGRAVARVAAQRRLRCRIYLPAGTSETRASLITGEGAEIVRVDGTYDAAVATAERAAEQPDTTLIADTAAGAVAQTAAWVIDGYSTLFREAATQGPVAFDLVMVPVGVGSLAAAAVRWAVHEHPTAVVVGVEPVAAACVTASLQAGEPVAVETPGTSMAGLDCATPSTAAWPTLRDGLAGTISVTDTEAHHAMRDLAALGLTIGDCGAATLAALGVLATRDEGAALRAAVRFNPSTTVLCIGSEGASDPIAYGHALTGPG
jgi:diaminopropionate ammonia-lyase